MCTSQPLKKGAVGVVNCTYIWARKEINFSVLRLLRRDCQLNLNARSKHRCPSAGQKLFDCHKGKLNWGLADLAPFKLESRVIAIAVNLVSLEKIWDLVVKYIYFSVN